MLTKEQEKEIDKLFNTIKSKKELIEKLKKYANPDGRMSMYIRVQFDNIRFDGDNIVVPNRH